MADAIANRSQKPARLCDGLIIFGRWIGFGDDAGADMEMRSPIF